MSILKSRKISDLFLAGLCIMFAADVHAPKTFKTIMTDALEKEWTPSSVSSIENRGHVVFIDNKGSYCLKVGADNKLRG